MTSRIGHSPEGYKLREQKQERIKDNIDTLIKVLMEENNERMKIYGERYRKTRNYEQYRNDLDKQQKFMLHRILTTLQ